MNPRESEDLKKIEKLAFKRKEACKGLVLRFHSLPKTAKRHADFHIVKSVYSWLPVPYSLWPIDISGFARELLNVVENGMRCPAETALLVYFLGDLPTEAVQIAIAAHEHEVRVGNYESLIVAQHKFDLRETKLAQRPDFQKDWCQIKEHFNVNTYRDPKQILRRTMVLERNFRPKEWNFQWRTKKERFQVVFDSFCHKWVLYGMEGERPLLQKLSVNITPFGTMIFIPRYWSFDRKRDLNWPAVNRLHRSREVHRQGVKLTPAQLARDGEAEKALQFVEQAKAKGLKGEAREDWVMRQLKWPLQTDARQLRRLLSKCHAVRPTGKHRKAK
jgi:hypothetical protein